MNQAELWVAMMEGKTKKTWPFPQAFAVLKRDIVMKKWQGHQSIPEFEEVKIPAGTKVRAVMASRFGDVGITDDLSVIMGYHYRVQCVPFKFDGREDWIKPEDLLDNIELIAAGQDGQS